MIEGGYEPNFITRNVVERSVAGAGASERRRLIDALAAASVVSNSASPRVSGKLKCLDVAAFHEFLDDYQELTCSRDVVTRLIQVYVRFAVSSNCVMKLCLMIARHETIKRSKVKVTRSTYVCLSVQFTFKNVYKGRKKLNL